MSEIIKDPTQMAFFALTIFSVLMLIPFSYQCYLFTEKNKFEKPEGYFYPSIGDMKLTVCAAMGFAATEIVTRKIAYHFFVPWCKV